VVVDSHTVSDLRAPRADLILFATMLSCPGAVIRLLVAYVGSESTKAWWIGAVDVQFFPRYTAAIRRRQRNLMLAAMACWVYMISTRQRHQEFSGQIASTAWRVFSFSISHLGHLAKIAAHGGGGDRGGYVGSRMAQRVAARSSAARLW